MKNLTLGLVCGLAFGAASVAVMIPMPFPGKQAAMSAAFINRFVIGLLIPLVTLPMPFWLGGLAIALLLSSPAAIVTKAYAPILGIGAVGGVIIGFIAGRFGG